jgi:hypothetical protein
MILCGQSVKELEVLFAVVSVLTVFYLLTLLETAILSLLLKFTSVCISIF